MEVVKKNVEEGIFMYGYSDIDLNKWEIDQEKMSVLWNLINLGYADTYFSSEEREVVEYIKEYWEISDSLYKEMIDVAETCLSLEKYKKWVESLPESDFKSEKLKKIKKDLKYVQKTIKTTISEVEFQGGFIMPIPLLFIAAGVGSGLLGVGKGIKAGID